MSSVIQFPLLKNSHKQLSEAAVAKVADYLSLRQSATETPRAFVRRIVAAYLEEVGS